MPTPFETVVDLWSAIIDERQAFAHELYSIANLDSYRERNLLHDFLDEVGAEQEAAVEKLLTSHGWTLANFEDTLWNWVSTPKPPLDGVPPHQLG